MVVVILFLSHSSLASTSQFKWHRELVYRNRFDAADGTYNANSHWNPSLLDKYTVNYSNIITIMENTTLPNIIEPYTLQ